MTFRSGIPTHVIQFDTMAAASQLSGIWKTLEAHNTEDILPGTTDLVGIFPSPYSQCAYFTVENVGI